MTAKANPELREALKSVCSNAKKTATHHRSANRVDKDLTALFAVIDSVYAASFISGYILGFIAAKGWDVSVCAEIVTEDFYV